MDHLQDNALHSVIHARYVHYVNQSSLFSKSTSLCDLNVIYVKISHSVKPENDL